MSQRRVWSLLGAMALTLPVGAQSLAERNAWLFQQLQQQRQLTDPQLAAVRAIFARSRFAGQGNPAISEHPDTPEGCREKLRQQGIDYANPAFAKICGAKFMAPLYDPGRFKAEQARVCIDQFEYPDIPCTYPVVWVKAREAAQICAAEGKRLCDAHEWEGACVGQLTEPDYPFDLARGVSPEVAIERMRAAHNREQQAHRSWSYGPRYRTGICATGSHKTPGCPGGGWRLCGSNTYPSGDFPACHSTLGVYDLNGNAAEHMNLPLLESQMASRGSLELGYTEMKGSWFIFDSYRAHEDWCRWRAPFWHGTRVMDPHSHANYHLGFRCCLTLPGKP
jgi:hypothetical protein